MDHIKLKCTNYSFHPTFFRHDIHYKPYFLHSCYSNSFTSKKFYCLSNCSSLYREENSDIKSENSTVKPLSVIPICIISLQLSFISSGPHNFPHKQCIIISDISFYKVLFSHISLSEFPVLTHNIPKMIIFEKEICKAM